MKLKSWLGCLLLMPLLALADAPVGYVKTVQGGRPLERNVSGVIGPRPQIAPKKQHFHMCITRHG